jgi:type II secretory pathway component PulF
MTVAGSLIMILFAIIQRMAMRLTYGARGPQPGDEVYFSLHVINRLLIVGSVAPLVVTMWWVAPLIILLILAAVIEGIWASRQLRRQTTASLLSLAAQRGLPLAGALFRHATDQGGAIGRATRRLAEDLERGEDLCQAIRRNHRAVPREAVAYAAVGDAVTDRGSALIEASRPRPVLLGGLNGLLLDRISYLTILCVFMVFLVTFMMIRIVPEFAKIFEEFDVQLPAATNSLISISNWVAHYSWIVFFPLLLFQFGLPIVFLLLVCGVPVFRGLGDRLMGARHRAVVLRCLALAADHGQPFEATIDALAKVYPSRLWRRRLRRAGNQQRSGREWSEALLRTGILRRASFGLVRAGQRVGNLPWTLRTAADREECREAYRWTAGLQVAFPIAILLLAAAVAFTCYALFVPLVELIHQLAPV